MLLLASPLVQQGVLAGTDTVIIPATAGPWSPALNPSFDYGVHDNSGPVVINASSGISFTTGATVNIAYVSGLAGNSSSRWDADGEGVFVTNTYEGVHGKFPAFYMIPSVPVYTIELVGAFANNGVIVGTPFAIGDGPTTVIVPAGANQLLLGANDNSYSDNAGSFTVTVTSASAQYHVCLLYDSTKAVNSEATLPVKLQLCDGSGNNSSSSTITPHARGITQVSTSISGDIQYSGNANPDSDFRFDSTLGSTGGYIYNLSTKALSTGTYNLNFTVTGDSLMYSAQFQVK